jgi:hypothetical protein
MEIVLFIIIFAVLLIFILDKNAKSIDAKVTQDKLKFENPLLSIELVPQSSWYSNVRSNVSKEQWDLIRRESYQKANYLCEICGGKGSTHPVECHEVWEYNEDTKIQKLVRFISLCPNCHKVKHIGLHGVNENIPWNNWDSEMANRYVDNCFAIWSRRSRMAWTLDLDYLKNGIDIQKNM